MKKPGTALCLGALLAGLLLMATGCTQETAAQPMGEDAIQHAVWVRLDRQNDIYYQLYTFLEDSLPSDDLTQDQLQVQSFCEGVNCLVRDEGISACYDHLYSDRPAVKEALRSLTGITAACELDRLPLADLPAADREALSACFRDLADCCDREKEGTFAYCIVTEDLDSEACQAAIQQVASLVRTVGEVSGAAGV